MFLVKLRMLQVPCNTKLSVVDEENWDSAIKIDTVLVENCKMFRVR